MGLLSNAIDRWMLEQGDHIYCYRNAHSYSHHGIYVGDNRVIHFTRTEEYGAPSSSNYHGCRICGFQPQTQRGVVKSCLDCFLKGDRLFRFEYNVSSNHFLVKKSGTCSTTSHDTPDVVLSRATEKLKTGFGDYDLTKNNCECFARFCKTGVSKSLQALSFKAKRNLAYNGLKEKPFSVNNVGLIFATGVKKYKHDTLNYDRHVHRPMTTSVDI